MHVKQGQQTQKKKYIVKLVSNENLVNWQEKNRDQRK